ncbi:MAG: gliding motility protein GldM [Flavobacteriales bacterium]|jgi:gliding motility-associated protein GldM
MASGNLSPRQKMINMMYLVLTALLALNVSSEVLNAFYQVMVKQEKANENIVTQNDLVHVALNKAFEDNEKKVGPWRDMAQEVKLESDSVFNLIENMKMEIFTLSGGPDEDDPHKPNKMDDRETCSNYFLNQGNADKLKSTLENHREFLKTKSDTSFVSTLDERFQYNSIVSDGVKKSWGEHSFKDVPLIAVMTYLTALQSDVRTSENIILRWIQAQPNADDIKVTGVKPVVIPKSTFVTQGDKYEAQVLLAAYDETQDPTFIINGQQISAEDISKGVANISFPASGSGTKKWNGEIRLVTNGETKVYPIEEQTYNVAPPSAVISPTELMVLYYGLENPLEISVPGVDPSNIIVKGTGVKRSGSGYKVNIPSSYKGETLTISVSVRNEDGSTRSMGSKKFRVFGVPAAEGGVNGKSNILMSKGKLANAKITASYKYFPYNITASVTSFEIVIPGVGPIKCRGNKLNSTAKGALKRTRSGSTITIRRIQGKTSQGGRIQVSDCSVDIN